MKSFSRISIALLAIACLAGPNDTLRAQDHDAMIASATAMDEAFIAAFNSGDMEAMAGMYWNSPDLVSFSPASMADRGHEAVVAGWTGFVGANPGATLALHDAVHVVAGEYVVTYGMFTMAIPTPDGGVHEINGRYTDLKGRVDGKWVYMHDHASAPLPPPPPSEE